MNNKQFLFLTMAALVILPRVTYDFYLTSMPAISQFMNVNNSIVQITLTVFMVGYAISVLIAGHFSDHIGNNKIIAYGLVIFLIASIICIFATSIYVLIVARFFQALGGCCGTVIARLMVKEHFLPQQQIKILAHLSAIMAICPLLTPLIGGGLQSLFGWQASFILVALFALFILLINIKNFNVSQKKELISFKTILLRYYILITDSTFLSYSLTIALSWSCYFIFSFESPFILQKLLKYNAITFGLLYAFPIIGYAIGTQLTRYFANRIGWDRSIFWAAVTMNIGSLLLILCVSFLNLSWQIIILPMAIVMMGVGVIIPCTQAAVMQPYTNIAGAASGLFFFIQMITGSAWGVILPFFSKSILLTMAVSILISGFLTLAASYQIVGLSTGSRFVKNLKNLSVR